MNASTVFISELLLIFSVGGWLGLAGAFVTALLLLTLHWLIA